LGKKLSYSEASWRKGRRASDQSARRKGVGPLIQSRERCVVFWVTLWGGTENRTELGSTGSLGEEGDLETGRPIAGRAREKKRKALTNRGTANEECRRPKGKKVTLRIVVRGQRNGEKLTLSTCLSTCRELVQSRSGFGKALSRTVRFTKKDAEKKYPRIRIASPGNVGVWAEQRGT